MENPKPVASSGFLALNPGNEVLLNHHVAVLLTGSDWKSWFQGQITQDIRRLAPNKPVQFAMCNRFGHLELFGWLHKQDNSEGIAIIPTACLQILLQRVDEFVIMEDCKAEVLPGSLLHSSESGGFPESRYGDTGFTRISDTPINSTISEDTVHAFALASLSPVFHLDSPPKTLAPEMGSTFVHNHISYDKGCYLGQEVIHRIYARGHVNRSWTVLACRSFLPAHVEILDTGGQKIGTTLGTAVHPQLGPLVSCFVRLDAAGALSAAGEPLTPLA